MKREIIQTSLEQFLRHGIRNISIQRLVTSLGISTKTFYKHFENKEDLLKETLLFYYDQHYLVIESQVEKESVVVLLCNIWEGSLRTELKINQTFFRDLLYYYPELNEKFTALSDKKFLKLFIRIIQRGIDEVIFKEGINPELVLNGMFVLYTAIARKEHFKKFNLTPLDLLLNSMLLYIRGLCTDRGLEEFNEHVQNLSTLRKAQVLNEIVL